MTDTTREDFEAWLDEPHPADASMTRRDYMPRNDGGFIFLAWQAATLKERERCAGICKAQAEAAKKAGNTQYQIGCLECLDEIGSGK